MLVTTRPPSGSNATPISPAPLNISCGGAAESSSTRYRPLAPDERLDDVEGAVGPERQALRPAEVRPGHFHLPVERHPVDVVARGEGGPAHVEMAVGAHRQVERGHRCRHRRHHRRVAVGQEAEDGARAVADQQRAVGREGQAAGDADVADRRLVVAALVDLVDDALEAAGDVELAVGPEGQGGGIHQAGHQRLAAAVAVDAEHRDRHLLSARPAVGDVQAALRVKGGAVHLVQAFGDHASHLEPRVAVGSGDGDGQRAAGQARWQGHREARGARRADARGHVADAHVRQDGTGDVEAVAGDRQPPAVGGRGRSDAGYTRHPGRVLRTDVPRAGAECGVRDAWWCGLAMRIR